MSSYGAKMQLSTTSPSRTFRLFAAFIAVLGALAVTIGMLETVKSASMTNSTVAQQLAITLMSSWFLSTSSAEGQVSSVWSRMSAMKKLEIADPVIVVEWNGVTADGAVDHTGDHLSKDDLLALARALGRMAARRDLAKAREDRARSATTSDVMPTKMPTKTLN